VKPARRHYKLNDAVIKKVRFLCEYGAPLEHIAPAVGVSYPAIKIWLSNAKGENPTEQEVALLAAVNEGRAAGGLRLASKIAESADAGDTRDAQWLLTHSPAFRRHYSDNAAVTRAFSDGVQACVAAVQAAGLTPEQERAVLLQISARTGEKLLSSDQQ
jgi:hypothetical protein